MEKDKAKEERGSDSHNTKTYYNVAEIYIYIYIYQQCPLQNITKEMHQPAFFIDKNFNNVEMSSQFFASN